MSRRDMLNHARHAIRMAYYTRNKRWLLAARHWIGAAECTRLIRKLPDMPT